MDVVNLNPLQSAIAAASGFAMDAEMADSAVSGIDFSALLALGLNSPSQNVLQPTPQEEIKVEAAIVADAQGPTPTPDRLLALPLLQQVSNADALASGTSAQEVPQAANVQATQTPKTVQTAPAAAADSADSTRTAVVADEPANIAVSGAHTAQPEHLRGQVQNVDQRMDITADPKSKQDLALDALRTHPSDTAPRADSLSHVLQVHPAETRAPLSQPSALLEVQAPVSEPGFAQALSRQVVWMVDKDAQVAELRINPPELGPVEVRLTLTHDSAAAEFVSPHAEVRAAIENAIVRLRESMAEAGIQLGQASVSAESFSQRADTQADSRHSGDGYRETSFAGHDAARSNPSPMTPRRGLVDVFA